MGFGIKEEFTKGLENKEQEPAAPAATPAVNETVNAEPAAPEVTEPVIDTPAEVQPTAQELNDEVVLGYLKQKNPNVNSLDELFIKPEPQTINPYADLEDNEDAQQFLKYAKETGRGINDFLKLREDVDTMPALDIARQRVRDELGRNDISVAQIDKMLEKRLNIDLSDPQELDETDALILESHAKPVRDARKADKEKYLQPLEKRPAAPGEEMVTLQNGEQVSKVQYEQMVIRQNYLNALKSSVDSVTEDVVKVNLGDNENPLEVALNYEYSPEDRHSMLSLASDVETAVKKLFGEGENFNHAKFQKALWRLDDKNWEKAISSAAQKVKAEMVQEFLKEEHNVNFSRNRMPGTSTPKPNVANVLDRPGFGVKFSI